MISHAEFGFNQFSRVRDDLYINIFANKCAIVKRRPAVTTIFDLRCAHKLTYDYACT